MVGSYNKSQQKDQSKPDVGVDSISSIHVNKPTQNNLFFLSKYISINYAKTFFLSHKNTTSDISAPIVEA